METYPSHFSTSSESIIELPPGFRFHPTDEELITHYLFPKAVNSSFSNKVIADADLNKVEPWDLPWKAKMGEKEWYFFCLKDRKYPTGSRTNRATEAGYWKATGKDREIFRGKALVGMKKTLVFYRGRAPKGIKTNWVMHEYRLDGKCSIRNLPNKAAKNEWVISRVFKKSSGGKKVHISCLRPSGTYDSQAVHLPPLMDMSINDRSQSGHVTCFSNSMEEDCHQVDKFSPTSLKNSALLPQVQANPSTEILQPCQDFYDLRVLLSTSNNPYTRQGMDVSSYGGSSYSGMKVYEDEQDGDYAGQVELDCLWNY